jgi:hypothetical protein
LTDDLAVIVRGVARADWLLAMVCRVCVIRNVTLRIQVTVRSQVPVRFGFNYVVRWSGNGNGMRQNRNGTVEHHSHGRGQHDGPRQSP